MFAVVRWVGFRPPLAFLRWQFFHNCTTAQFNTLNQDSPVISYFWLSVVLGKLEMRNLSVQVWASALPAPNLIGITLGAQKRMGENLKVVWAEFSSCKFGCFITYAIAQHTQARSSLELKTWPKFCPISIS
jgi:hypothetical protein